jgi:hypothetical protein
MPFVFGIIGIVLVVSGVRGTTSQLTALVKSDFTGTPNYLEWMVAIFLVGAVGYIKELNTISRMFMALVVIGLLWSNKGVFSQFTSGIEQPAEQVPSGFNLALNNMFETPTPETTSVQPTDTLQLAENALQNTNI